MNRIPSLLLKITGTLILITVSVLPLWAQKPEVRNLDKTTGSTSEVIRIKGSSFGTDSTKLAVTFGARRGPVVSVSNEIIEAKVPPGATFDNVSVTNLVSGLTGYSSNQFLLSFGGEHPFNVSNLSAQLNFDSEKGLGDLHFCDLNNDRKVDIVTANAESNSISLFRNTSTVGTISFTKIVFTAPSTTFTLNCDDLNGDGLQDIVLVDNNTAINNKIFILKNNGSFSFTLQEINLTGRENQAIEIADIDLDGRAEIILSDRNPPPIGLFASVAILQNTSSPGAISFSATPLLISIPEKDRPLDDVVAEDLNGDGFPEILTTQNSNNTNNAVYVFPNLSSPGSMSFGTTISLLTGSKTVKHIKVGDLDGDSKPDIAVTNGFESMVSFFRNTGTGSSISFATIQQVVTDVRPFGLDFGDMDGDGKTDIVIAHAQLTKLTILNNTSTPGAISFVNQTVTTTYTNRHIKVGDLDGDGKPDVAFTSVDQGTTVISKVSVFRNRSCVVPKLNPVTTPISICSNFLPYHLQATVSPGANYEWLKDGTLLPAANNGLNKNGLDVTAALGSGEYTVRIIGEGGTCSKESTIVDISIGTTGNTTNPVPAPNGSPLCAGSPLTLNVTIPIGGGALYKWTGPNGFAPAPTTLLSVPVTSDFRLEHAGTYYLEVIDGTGNCISSKTSTEVKITDVPTFAIAGPESVVLCQGSSPPLTLSVSPDPDGYTYQWYKDGALFGGSGTGKDSPAISSASTASTGNYTVKASNALCGLNIDTSPVNVKVVTVPIAAFTRDPAPPDPACAGQKVEFANDSETDNSATAFYKWYFGDTQTSTEENPTHIYTAPNLSYTVKLEVTYANGACLDDVTGTIEITAAVVPQIINTETSGKFDFCEGQSITLGVTGSNITSYSWSTGATTPTIEVSEGATYSVDVKSDACTLSAFKEVIEIDGPAILITATPEQINEGETSQLLASGISTFTWTPIETIESDPTLPNPVVRPLVTTTYTVTGNDGGCEGSATIEVRVIGEAIVSKLLPSNFFSPNESPPNDTWVVDKIQDYPQCSITIYDDKGVRVFDAKPYNNDWDGTFNGKKLPDGVYFYIIRCEGEENKPRTGSITLLR